MVISSNPYRFLTYAPLYLYISSYNVGTAISDMDGCTTFQAALAPSWQLLVKGYNT
jgi:hypothetical protein